MTTKQLSEETGAPRLTIMRYVAELDAVPIGGSHGYEFPSSAPKRLRAILRQRRGGAQWRIFQMRKKATENGCVITKTKTDSVSEFLAFLKSHTGWITAKQLSHFANDRTLRLLANASDGRIITGQRGYKAASQATPDEIARSACWLEHQGQEMLHRACGIRKSAAKSSKCKKARFVKHHRPRPK